MSINKSKKVAAASALAAMFAGGSVSGLDFKSAIGGSLAAALGLGIADVGFNKNPWNPLKKAMGADEGLWKKWTTKPAENLAPAPKATDNK